MALSEKHRSSIYHKLSRVIGEEEVEALLAQFPASDLDRPATNESVQAEISGLRSTLQAEIDGVRIEVAGVRTDLAELESRISDRFREMTLWVAGALIAGMGVSAGVAAGIASLIR